ncbi:hypothetical protein DSM106972_032370 [Dulcicalothrix desertica PCC 7102]|uniref:SD-repeat containing protein B domain-containing protein n=1 Tax=Dulcicalothrix desertica PCC 7102 TaxID=232991 RepID=A0A3S1AP80_9CYAN|nr:carboxypeptidase-like regulatory domain-containing protein [Dulcicalothrix desertica]RUT06031.1 hypothetical protein DSM106972_032370 [Dulcicalothrix desertica PCC 7102]TWH54302.1 carboxypeptidase family protein [Dulcicalothrix desertica PCC 7102]
MLPKLNSSFKKIYLLATIAFVYLFLPNAANGEISENTDKPFAGNQEESAIVTADTLTQSPPQIIDWERLREKSMQVLQQRLRQNRLQAQEVSSTNRLSRINNLRTKLLNYSQSEFQIKSKTDNSPNQINELSQSSISTNSTAPSENFSVFPVGLSLGKRNVNPSVMIRGKEDGTQAVNFRDWLVPFEDVVRGLNFSLQNLPDGQIEVRSPGLVTRIDPKKLRTDPELGLVFSIQDLDSLFGIKAKFDVIEYAIELDVPWQSKSSGRFAQSEAPIILEGLPRIFPDTFSLGAIEQRFNASGTQSTATGYRGDLLAVGSAFGGSWFLRTDQPNFQDSSSWRIAEAQFYRPTNQTDYILGSQPTFWRSNSTNDYWGFTFIQRNGFVPPQLYASGFVDPRQRLQSAQIGRTITGRTEPGTLVRLVEGFGERIIGEVLVDSSGIYRFENVKSDNQFLNSSYRVLLYPEGRLTAQPIVQEATYSVVPGQIPAGASALVFSGGLRREFENPSLLGSFSEFRGGIAQRWGVSESLTVGVGGIYDDNARGLAEVFFRPSNLPLQVAVSALSGNKWDINADVRFNPTRNISASYTRDRFANRFNLDWQVLSGLSLFASTDSRNATAGGVQVNFSGKNAFTFARVSVDTQNRWRWTWLQRLGQLELNQRGNEIGTLSELSFNLSRGSSFLNLGNSLLLGYETRSQNSNDNLLSLGWRYRSEQRATDGSYLWETQLGYGFGSQGSGLIASLSTAVLPGMLLRARYQGISVTSDEASFSLDLVSSLGLQRGITPEARRTDNFRTQGGMLIQAFFDKNNNGKHDTGEAFYTENSDTLLNINNRVIKSFQPTTQSDRLLVRLNPGTYRLDLDPAGFPEDWQVKTDAYAVDVIAGSYTPILLPLTRAYTISGVVTDTQGKALSGVRVEAVSADNKVRLFSVTNTAGVYYLERLQQGNYKLLVNDKTVGSKVITLDENSKSFAELNIQELENQQFQAIEPNQSELQSSNKEK